MVRHIHRNGFKPCVLQSYPSVVLFVCLRTLTIYIYHLLIAQPQITSLQASGIDFTQSWDTFYTHNDNGSSCLVVVSCMGDLKSSDHY